MKSKPVILVILLTVFIGFIVAAYADTRYVSDMLILAVRDKQENGASVLGILKSADSIEVLEESGQYLRIRTQGGLEGWVQKNYITSDKPKAVVIKDLKAAITQLKSTIEELKKIRSVSEDKIEENIRVYKLKIKAIDGDVSRLKAELRQLTEKYNALLNDSKKSINTLIDERDTLKTKNKELNTKIDDLEKNYYRLPGTKRTQFFLAGAGVLLLGFLLGLSIKRKKSYY